MSNISKHIDEVVLSNEGKVVYNYKNSHKGFEFFATGSTFKEVTNKLKGFIPDSLNNILGVQPHYPTVDIEDFKNFVYGFYKDKYAHFKMFTDGEGFVAHKLIIDYDFERQKFYFDGVVNYQLSNRAVIMTFTKNSTKIEVKKGCDIDTLWRNDRCIDEYVFSRYLVHKAGYDQDIYTGMTEGFIGLEEKTKLGKQKEFTDFFENIKYYYTYGVATLTSIEIHDKDDNIVIPASLYINPFFICDMRYKTYKMGFNEDSIYKLFEELELKKLTKNFKIEVTINR